MQFLTRILVAALAIVLIAGADVSAKQRVQKARVEIGVSYEKPDDPDLMPIYDMVKAAKVLERVRTLLGVFRLPEKMSLRFAECIFPDAQYNSETKILTMCYEYVADMQSRKPGKAAAGLTQQDAVIGSILFTFLHESGHALFDLLKIPILGREEDAADGFAMYLLLQLNNDEAARVVKSVAFMHAKDANEQSGSVDELADVHSLSAQRYFTALCLAYGKDAKLFADVLTLGHVPQMRAGSCAAEYRLLAYSVRKLFGPYVDRARVRKDVLENLLAPSAFRAAQPASNHGSPRKD